MVYKGIIRGKVIELEAPLPYQDGQPVNVSVQPLEGESLPGTPGAIRRVMHESPHLRGEDVDELERIIGEGRLPVSDGGPFAAG